MSKFAVVCPHCKGASTVEKSNFVDRYGLQEIKCPNCSKSWAENVREFNGLAKSASAPSTELAELRVQVRGQMDELLGKINGLLQQVQQREAASRRFQPNGVEKSDAAEHEIQKARSNRTLVTLQSTSVVERTEARRFQPDGVHKADAADQELEKALANGKPATWD